MTAADLRAAMDRLRWSIRTLAAALGVERTTIQRWLEGRYPVPEDVAAWLRRRLASEAADPAPARLRRAA